MIQIKIHQCKTFYRPKINTRNSFARTLFFEIISKNTFNLNYVPYSF